MRTVGTRAIFGPQETANEEEWSKSSACVERKAENKGVRLEPYEPE